MPVIILQKVFMMKNKKILIIALLFIFVFPLVRGWAYTSGGYSHNENSIVPLMTANDSPSPVVVSSTGVYSGYEIYKAFTQSPVANWWYSGGSSNQEIIIDLGVGGAKAIDSYTMTSIFNCASYPSAPGSFLLLGSVDSVSWVQLDSQSDLSLWVNLEMRTFVLSEASSEYRYFKFVLTGPGGSSYYQLAAIELIGAAEINGGASGEPFYALLGLVCGFVFVLGIKQ